MLTPTADPLGLARTIERLLGDPLFHDRLAIGGRKAYEAGYGPARAIERWRVTLRDIAGLREREALASGDRAGGTPGQMDITV